MSSTNVWNANLYDDKLNFVSNFGKSMINLLQPQKDEKILDLGCGTGDLTYEISQSGAVVTGMDASEEMIVQARKKYPQIQFLVDNAKTFRTVDQFEAIFSNAALHWIKQPEPVVESVSHALQPGGRFVAEFGGKGNVATVIEGISEVLAEEYGIDASQRNPWYFPSIGEYSSLLEHHGFKVTFAQHFKRPTPLADGEKGLNHWLHGFAGDFFPELSDEEQVDIFEKVKNKIQLALFKDGVWIADYERIRIVAIKKNENY